MESIYGEKLRFFNNYVEQQNITSKVVLGFLRDHLKQEYMFELMNPRTTMVHLPNDEIIYNPEIDGIQYLIAKEYGQKETFFSSREYFKNISFQDINRPDLKYNKHFRENLSLFIRNFFESTEPSLYTKEKFLAEKKFIENNLDKIL